MLIQEVLYFLNKLIYSHIAYKLKKEIQYFLLKSHWQVVKVRYLEWEKYKLI